MKIALIAAVSALALSGGAAFAQTTTTSGQPAVVVPGASEADSAVPAGEASTAVTGTDAPVATDDTSTSAIPVPGNSSGVESAMPADAAARVVTPTDAPPVPGQVTSPVPGTAANGDVKPAN
ncbi:hypothetical protein [Aureimonas sp. SK2]|uniref:hypothetical protein n=1 Tax=Aureimonas sp. SK2 TaxID=3015992 RepID=UPI0024450592|nr:hypothetical protein [Aureimonas sp. SK2]